MELIECIERIPSLLQKQGDNYKSIKEKINVFNKSFNEIVVIGSGTSLNAAKVTRYFAKSIGIKVLSFYPNEFLNSYQYINQDALYVFISQGGTTKLVYDCLTVIKEQHLSHIAITASLESPISKHADVSIEMGCEDEEFLYRTIGYSTSVLSMCLIEMGIANLSNEKENEILSDLSCAINNLKSIKTKALDWYKSNQFSLMKRTKCILSGSHYLHETANEADIKLMEMIPMITRSFELEELIHGPQNAFDDQTIFFILADRLYDEEKTKSIKSFIKNEIGFCTLVGDIQVDERDLFIEYRSTSFRMLEVITTFQVISYCMSKDRGRDLTRPVNGCVKKYINKSL